MNISQTMASWSIRINSVIPTCHDKPLASHGLISYRYKTPYGWCMIGAKDHEDALREAKRSIVNPQKEDLQIWDGIEYVDAYMRKCNRCHNPVGKSELEEYSYSCDECEEDLYGIETYLSSLRIRRDFEL